MAKLPRDTGLNLLQQNPSRELMLERMRSKLAATPKAAQVETLRKKEVRRGAARTWSLRALGLLALCAINYLLMGNRDLIAAKLQKPAVPRLPAAAAAMSVDEQALYYVYALYDYPKLRELYKIDGFYAVNQADAKRRLEDLLPRVSPRTLGKISTYMPVAFRKADGGPGL